jgi:hypothetical protein
MASRMVPPQVRSLRRKLIAATTTSRKSLTSFPLASYLSIHLLLSTFLLFSFGFLPQSEAFWRRPSQGDDAINKQVISADRPEHPFLTPITSDPIKTMVLEVIGVSFCMVWWSGHLRSWWRLAKSMEKKASVGDTPVDSTSVVVREDLWQRLEVSLVMNLHRLDKAVKQACSYSRQH